MTIEDAEKLKPIPKYLRARIERKDKQFYPAPTDTCDFTLTLPCGNARSLLKSPLPSSTTARNCI